MKGQFEEFLQFLKSRSLDSENFKSVTDRLNSNQPVHDLVAQLASGFPLVSVTFLNCFFNESLADISKEELLHECAASLPPTITGIRSLKVLLD